MNDISPVEPCFATFYYNGFQLSKENFGHLFEAVCKSVPILDFIDIKDRNLFLWKMKKLRWFRISGDIWSPGEIWFNNYSLPCTVNVVIFAGGKFRKNVGM